MSVECQVQSVKRSVNCIVWSGSVNCRVRIVKCKVQSVGCKVLSVGCQVWSVECKA